MQQVTTHDTHPMMSSSPPRACRGQDRTKQNAMENLLRYKGLIKAGALLILCSTYQRRIAGAPYRRGNMAMMRGSGRSFAALSPLDCCFWPPGDLIGATQEVVQVEACCCCC